MKNSIESLVEKKKRNPCRRAWKKACLMFLTQAKARWHLHTKAPQGIPNRRGGSVKAQPDCAPALPLESYMTR